MDLRQLGKYEIVGKIGQGAMGEVFKAHDPILGRDVAIKTMTAAIGGDEELRKRFHREAQSAARLSHPNIITIYDFGEDQGKVYMAMELLEGNDLKDLIGRHTPMALEQKLGLMEQICDGLAFAHAKDVVHRDLKPANIHIQRGGQIKIMDFGLAKLASSDMTRAGMIMGTPNYMSPEQVRGEKATARSDVFSLGAVFYELLTNRKPFEADSLHAVLFQVMQNEPEALANLVPDIPPALQHVVERAMAKDPNARFQDAGEMRDGLRPARAALAQWAAGGVLPAPEADATIIGIFDPLTQPPSVSMRPPSPGSRPPAPAASVHPPTPVPSTEGAVALEPKSRRPAETVTPNQPGTLSGKSSTQVPAATPATPVPASPPTVLTKSHPPAPAPIVHPPTPIPAKSHPPAPVPRVVHPPTPLPTVPLPVTAPPVVIRSTPPPVPIAPAARQVRPVSPPTPPPAGARPALAEPPRPAPTPDASRPTPPDGEGAGWRVPVFAGGAVLVVLAAIGMYLLTGPDPRPSPSPSTSTTLRVVDPAVSAHVDAARKALAGRNFKLAVAETSRALAKDPENADARQLLDQAESSLKRIDAAIADVRRAIDANDTATASRALEQLLSLDAAHPAVPQFREALNSAFRSRAEQAQNEMKQAQREATQARAAPQAEFKAAVLTAREAEALLAKNEFVNAVQKFYQAKQGFDRAREAQRELPPPTLATPVAPTTTTTATTLSPPTTTLAPPPRARTRNRRSGA